MFQAEKARLQAEEEARQRETARLLREAQERERKLRLLAKKRHEEAQRLVRRQRALMTAYFARWREFTEKSKEMKRLVKSAEEDIARARERGFTSPSHALSHLGVSRASSPKPRHRSIPMEDEDNFFGDGDNFFSNKPTRPIDIAALVVPDLSQNNAGMSELFYTLALSLPKENTRAEKWLTGQLSLGGGNGMYSLSFNLTFHLYSWDNSTVSLFSPFMCNRVPVIPVALSLVVSTLSFSSVWPQMCTPSILAISLPLNPSVEPTRSLQRNYTS